MKLNIFGLKKYASFLINNPKASFRYLRRPKFALNQLFYLLGVKLRFPDLESIVLYVNSTCNLKCVMCDIGQRNNKGIDKLRAEQQNKNLDIDLLKKLLADPYIRKRKLQFNLLMTEPLLHPEIGEIVRLIKKKGHIVKITTNGYLLPKKAKELISAGLDAIKISMDGPEEINDKIRGVKGAYRNAIEGIKIINQDKKMEVSINYTISCVNDKEILNFLENIDKEGIKVDSVKFQFMDFISKDMVEKQNSNYDIKQTESCISDMVHPSKVDVEGLSKQLNSIKKNYNNIKKVGMIPHILGEEAISRYFDVKGGKIGNSKCFIPWHHFAFTTDGKILIHMRCFNYVYGDFNKSSMKEIFYNKRIESFRRKLRKANFCFPACTRCCGVMTTGLDAD